MKGFMSNPMIDKNYGWHSIEITDTGKVRKINEDSCLSNESQAHWVVADGMGGHQAGDLASQMIVNNLKPLEQNESLSDFVENVENTLFGVNENLFKLAQSRNTVIGSTVVGAALHQGHVLLYWVGDSRGYVFRNNKLIQLTVDHTLVQELLEDKKITAHQAKNHPEKNVITRAIGTHSSLHIDYYITPIQPDDVLIVCSDGIEKEIEDSELENILRETRNINKCANKILSEVLERGARDNVTFVLVEPISLCDVTRQ